MQSATGGLLEAAEDAGKPREVVVIAAARKLAVIANAMIRDGTEWDPEANARASAESESVSASDEKSVGEAKLDEACNFREESAGGETVEPEASARGGSSRGRDGKPGGRSEKTLEWTSGTDRVPDRTERRKLDILAAQAEPGCEAEMRIDSGADRIQTSGSHSAIFVRCFRYGTALVPISARLDGNSDPHISKTAKNY